MRVVVCRVKGEGQASGFVIICTGFNLSFRVNVACTTVPVLFSCSSACQAPARRNASRPGPLLPRPVRRGHLEHFQWSIFDPQVRERIINSFPDPEEGATYLALLEPGEVPRIVARVNPWAIGRIKGVQPTFLTGLSVAYMGTLRPSKLLPGVY